ncbi:MAG: ABC transporter permease [Hyphomicrobiales bacterium]
MKPGRGATLLLVPGLGIFLAFLVLPLANVVEESFRLFVPGRIGAAKDAPYTLFNYAELLDASYLYYFVETARFGVMSSVIALLLAFPIAYAVARQRSALVRKVAVGALIGMMFLSTLVRVYALQLTFGPTGIAKILAGILGVSMNGRFYTEMVVVLGLLHYLVPISALTLLGTIQNVNPRLSEAAQALGAPRWVSHFTVTVPLCVPGLLSAFLISFTLCLSAFVVPMILGKGKVLFVSNLIYARFSEIANYPSGSAVSIVMLVLSLLIIYGVTRVVTARWIKS